MRPLKFAVVQTLLGLAVPWPLKLVVDHAIGPQPLQSWLAGIGPLSPYAIAFLAAGAGIALVAFGGVIRYAGTYLSGAVSERIGAATRSAVFGGSPPSIRQVNPHILALLDCAITALLASDPAARPATALGAMRLLIEAMTKRQAGLWPEWVSLDRAAVCWPCSLAILRRPVQCPGSPSATAVDPRAEE